MNKITEQMNSGKYTVLFLDSSYINESFTHICVEGVEMKAIIAFDLPNAIAVEEKGNFIGKTISFLKK